MTIENPLAKLKETAKALAKDLNANLMANAELRERVFNLRATIEQAIPHVAFARDMLLEAYGQDETAWSDSEKEEVARVKNLLENMEKALTDRPSVDHTVWEGEEEQVSPVILLSESHR